MEYFGFIVNSVDYFNNKSIIARIKAAMDIPRVTQARTSLNLKFLRDFSSRYSAFFPSGVMDKGALSVSTSPCFEA